MAKKSKLILVDGNSIAFRAFYALPLLSNSSGLHTNAAFGFTTMLMKLIEEEQPTHFLVAFDAGKITFRNEQYADYKGGRAKTPPELSEQFPIIKELLSAFNISQYELPGYEADDLIGTMSALADKAGIEVMIVTGDKDMLQLASEHVTIALTRRGISEIESYTPAYIQETYGLTPEQIIDLKGLMGDTSDNIPGVPGVGEKTALKLLHEYGSVEKVLDQVEQLKGKLKERMIEHKEQAILSKQLATIVRDVPMELKVEDTAHQPYDVETVKSLLQKLEFKSILNQLDLPGSEEEAIEQEELSVTIIEQTEVEEWAKKLQTEVILHVEVIGENPHEADIVGFGFYIDEAAYYVPFDVVNSEQGSGLRAWLADETKSKYMFDAHKAEVALSWQHVHLTGIEFDVLLAGYVIDPTNTNLTLSGLVQSFTQKSLKSDEQVFGKGAKFAIPKDQAELAEHMGRKAEAIAMLVPFMKEKLEEYDMHSLYYDLELPLSVVLADMEKKGIRIDVEQLTEYGKQLDVQINQLVEEVYEHAGTEFNLNSPKQLGEILFERLGLPPIKKTKTGYSTNAEVLEKLAPQHEIVALILQYRQLAKLRSTYVEGLVKEVRGGGQKIHTYYRQAIASTGRLSSQFPNLQNIPIRTEEGRKIRQVFVPSEPDWVILSCDYSQIELRVLAHISDDERMKEAFLQEQDIHTKTAMDVFGVDEENVDAEMRRQAKAVNFGIVYGMSDYGLSQNLNITRKQAAEFIEQYFRVFEGVRSYMDSIVQDAKRDGYVTTLLHRRRNLPEINASNFNLRSFAERTAMNTPIQGTAADIIKLAMVQLYTRMKEEGLQSRMLLQVHDELVFEVPKNELDHMKQLVPEVMENALSLDVPLKVDVSFGANWDEAN